jgi:hypothetical protein
LLIERAISNPPNPLDIELMLYHEKHWTTFEVDWHVYISRYWCLLVCLHIMG